MNDQKDSRSAAGYDLRPLSAEQVAELSEGLDDVARHVACDAGTERAFTGPLWNNKEPGVYCCIVCGLPLFRSETKFDSGTGWPSFFQPFDPEHVIEHHDDTHGMIRIEVVCARSGSHLGHVFPDGPPPTNRRYCINSASLTFHPEGEDLAPQSEARS